jgi:hypothetical protein
VADLQLTAALLTANSGAYESNPFAAACLEQYGWHGLAMYKAAGVVAFAGAVFLLVQRRPKVAAGVVTFGCAVLVAVTTYSHGLIVDSHRQPVSADHVYSASARYADLPFDGAD